MLGVALGYWYSTGPGKLSVWRELLDEEKTWAQAVPGPFAVAGGVTPPGGLEGGLQGRAG